MSDSTDKVESAEDFMRGQLDCKTGVPHQAGQSNDYDRGYSAQYTHEQIKAEMTR